MILAKGTIIVNKKRYGKGQTVTGLSKADIRWMKEHGFIEEVPDRKKPDKEGEKTKNDV